MDDDKPVTVTAESIACGTCSICGCELYRGMEVGNVGVTFVTPTYNAKWCNACAGKAFKLLAQLVEREEILNG